MKTDFRNEPIWLAVLKQGFPLMVAQLVHILYNVVDRVYIGHLPGVGSMALTGIGLAFPITTLVAAFTNMFGMGGAPLFSIHRGAGEEEKAEKMLGQVTSYLFITSIILFVVCYIWRKPILYLFGASDASYPYADEYLKIYLFGTTAAMLSTGLNPFINAQGYPNTVMLTIVIGAVANLILDPIFIFRYGMGVKGAALATIISQFISAIYVLSFFWGKKTMYRIRKEHLIPDLHILKEVSTLGFANFIMQATNTLVSILCNVTLRNYGGDIYVGVMTILNSVREILSLPSISLANGAQPVISFNFGSKLYSRVKKAIRFTTYLCTIYLLIAWAIVFFKPDFFINLFSDDQTLIKLSVNALRIYFFGFVFMAFQSAGQNSFTAMKCSKRAIFFSLLRKVIIVAPLTIILPRFFGVDGVFMAEPISNVIGGLACYITMYYTQYKRLPADGEEFV